MKHAPRSQQHHDFYAKYHHQDSKISALLGECGLISLDSTLSATGPLELCVYTQSVDSPRATASGLAVVKASDARAGSMYRWMENRSAILICANSLGCVRLALSKEPATVRNFGRSQTGEFLLISHPKYPATRGRARGTRTSVTSFNLGTR